MAFFFVSIPPFFTPSRLFGTSLSLFLNSKLNTAEYVYYFSSLSPLCCILFILLFAGFRHTFLSSFSRQPFSFSFLFPFLLSSSFEKSEIRVLVPLEFRYINFSANTLGKGKNA